MPARCAQVQRLPMVTKVDDPGNKKSTLRQIPTRVWVGTSSAMPWRYGGDLNPTLQRETFRSIHATCYPKMRRSVPPPPDRKSRVQRFLYLSHSKLSPSHQVSKCICVAACAAAPRSRFSSGSTCRFVMPIVLKT